MTATSEDKRRQIRVRPCRASSATAWRRFRATPVVSHRRWAALPNVTPPAASPQQIPGLTAGRPGTYLSRDAPACGPGMVQPGPQCDGLRRSCRLDLAMTLVGGRQIIFLDEPTTGLDARSRRAMWQIIRRPGRRRDHDLPHHAVPRRSRPARRPHQPSELRLLTRTTGTMSGHLLGRAPPRLPWVRRGGFEVGLCLPGRGDDRSDPSSREGRGARQHPAITDGFTDGSHGYLATFHDLGNS